MSYLYIYRFNPFACQIRKKADISFQIIVWEIFQSKNKGDISLADDKIKKG